MPTVTKLYKAGKATPKSLPASTMPQQRWLREKRSKNLFASMRLVPVTLEHDKNTESCCNCAEVKALVVLAVSTAKLGMMQY